MFADWSMMTPLAFFSPSPSEMMLVAIIALLLFGKDLPEVARQWGKVFSEFRRHVSGIRNELNDAIYAEPQRPRLQYHPEFQKRDPLPEAIPAETNGAPAAAGGPGVDSSSDVPSD